MTLLTPGTAEAAGPWRARVVDAENGAPIEGVVVLAIWRREASDMPIALLSSRTGYDSAAEKVTDSNGHVARVLTGADTAEGRLGFPGGLAIGSDGTVYLTNAAHPRVRTFSRRRRE